jgi:hypothetical protein
MILQSSCSELRPKRGFFNMKQSVLQGPFGIVDQTIFDLGDFLVGG